MALSVKQGTFSKATSTGNQAITGIGFQPKVLILWASRQTSLGADASFGLSDGATFFMGFAIATGQFCGGWGARDGSDTSRTIRMASLTSCIRIRNPQVSTVDLEDSATLNSLDTDGFTLNWSVASASAYKIHYLAIGGSDITNTYIGSFTPSVLGTFSVTGVGFKPDIIFTMNSTPDSGVAADAKFGIGVAISSTNQGAIGVQTANAQAVTIASTRQQTDRCTLFTRSNDSIDGDCSLTSMNNDGFTLNVVHTDTDPVYFLAIKGGSWNVGNFLATNSSEPVTQTISGLGFQPKGLLLFGRGRAAGTTATEDASICVGATDDTHQSMLLAVDEDGDGTPDSISSITDASILATTEAPAATASSTFIYTEAEEAGFNSGSFDLSFSNTYPTRYEWIYVVCGNGVTGSPTAAHSFGTIIG